MLLSVGVGLVLTLLSALNGGVLSRVWGLPGGIVHHTCPPAAYRGGSESHPRPIQHSFFCGA
jgi:hypothetical protein